MKILVKAVAGSHLFGTNTEKSDHDYKGVFLPDAEDILLGKFNQVLKENTNKTNTKNTQDDIDIELYSLDKFLTMLYQGQTVAWELLFTPDDKLLEMHSIWRELQAAAPLLVSKKVDAFVGYCKQQANKYGIRGSRMNSLEAVIAYLDTNVQSGNDKLSTVCLEPLLKLEHVEMIKDKNGKDLFVVCGKKFGLDTAVRFVEIPLTQYYKEYGERSKLAAQNEGIDWKAISHALRVCIQAVELLKTGKLTFPMNKRYSSYLRAVKAGKIEFEYVREDLEMFMDRILEAQKRSKLRDEPDLKAFQDLQIRIYKMIIGNEL